MKLWILLLAAMVFLAGCQMEVFDNGSRKVGDDGKTMLIGKLDVFTMCGDGVVCYYHSGGYDGGMACFRDADLIEEYC